MAVALAAATSFGLLNARAEGGKGDVVEYKHGDVALEGYLAGPASGSADVGVLVIHEWWGHNDYARHRADELAKLGYAAFALDMYGKGVKTDDAGKAKELSGPFYKDRALFRARAAAGLEQLKSSKFKPKALAAIGYCFGGTGALELARSGADLKGVVAFHAGLSTPNPADAKNMKAKVLVCAGGDDGFVPEKEISDFEAEMRAAGVDWQLNSYGGAVHSFTNPDADKHGIKGIAYNERADKRSWIAMQDFFHEVFGK
jgi:dienelactone hydrolase